MLPRLIPLGIALLLAAGATIGGTAYLRHIEEQYGTRNPIVARDVARYHLPMPLMDWSAPDRSFTPDDAEATPDGSSPTTARWTRATSNPSNGRWANCPRACPSDSPPTEGCSNASCD